MGKAFGIAFYNILMNKLSKLTKMFLMVAKLVDAKPMLKEQ